MLINLLPFVSLISVPALVLFLSGLCAFTNLTVLVPKFFFRKAVTWQEYSTPNIQNDWFHQRFYGGGYCSTGVRMFPENGTVYLQSGLTSGNSVAWRYLSNVDNQRVPLTDRISGYFQTVVMDCPELKFSNVSAEWQDLSRIFTHLKWITAHNKKLPPERPKLKVWFRLSTHGNNVVRFDDHFCVGLAMAANRQYAGTVTGLLLNGDFISPLVTLSSSPGWERSVTTWKQNLKKFGLKTGLMLSPSSCSALTLESSLTRVLSEFDYNIYHFIDDQGAMSNHEMGVNWIVTTKFLDCRRALSVNVPWLRVESVRDVVEDLYLVFLYSSVDKLCIIYD